LINWFVIGFETLTVSMHLGLNWWALCTPCLFMGTLFPY